MKCKAKFTTFFPERFRPIVLAPCLLLQVATSMRFVILAANIKLKQRIASFF